MPDPAREPLKPVETYRFSVEVPATPETIAHRSLDLLGPLAPLAAKTETTAYGSGGRFVLVLSPPRVVSTEEGTPDEDPTGEGVTEFALETVVPNPTRGSASVRLSLPEAGEVAVAVYDAMGRLVGERRQSVVAGRHALAVPVAGLAPGAYVVRVEAPSGTGARRLTVIR